MEKQAKTQPTGSEKSRKLVYSSSLWVAMNISHDRKREVESVSEESERLLTDE